jgi:hypothetical protein
MNLVNKTHRIFKNTPLISLELEQTLSEESHNGHNPSSYTATTMDGYNNHAMHA